MRKQSPKWLKQLQSILIKIHQPSSSSNNGQTTISVTYYSQSSLAINGRRLYHRSAIAHVQIKEKSHTARTIEITPFLLHIGQSQQSIVLATALPLLSAPRVCFPQSTKNQPSQGRRIGKEKKKVEEEKEGITYPSLLSYMLSYPQSNFFTNFFYF